MYDPELVKEYLKEDPDLNEYDLIDIGEMSLGKHWIHFDVMLKVKKTGEPVTYLYLLGNDDWQRFLKRYGRLKNEADERNKHNPSRSSR